ncbi:RHS repeat-associated protein [Flavobacterium branchiophilum]|uniref:RHS repeat-associated protein n=4 Tax=Flavobacterium branchiophilum TaxID=55197 RepID=A0A543FZR1_9FLAO|nr:RHS repeat-associated protein [Flavobacterium branchiophilum]
MGLPLSNFDNLTKVFFDNNQFLNRLLEAVYQKPEQPNPIRNSYNERLLYDKNGNIMRLLRNGEYDDAVNVLEIDRLDYTYNYNQLMGVADSTNNPNGFKDSNTEGDDYRYDLNGNMTMDLNKNITSITYNHLNLPTKILFGEMNSILYFYTASGQKVNKVVNEAGVITTTDYINGFQYKTLPSGDGGLVFFPHAEGYVNVNESYKLTESSLYNYVFNYTDHLGNIRMSYTQTPTGALSILEENHYYPFGLKHTNYNSDKRLYVRESVASKIKPVTPLFPLVYNYKYNGKEWQDELGLNVYDLGARMYMADIGKFAVVDPMADFVNYQSPYIISDNNPVLNVDEYGLGILNVIGNLFKRLVGAIGSIGNDCSCNKYTQESVGRAWSRADFPILYKKINDLFNGNGKSKPTPISTVEEERQPVIGINLDPIGIKVNDNFNIQAPEINIPKSRFSSIVDDDPLKLKQGHTININIAFESFSPKIDYASSNKTLNDLLKTLKEYPQIMLLIQGNVRNSNYPNLKENTMIQIDGTNGSVGDLQLLRAKAIKKFLVNRGIDPERLSVGKGVISNNTRSATLQGK